MAIKLEMLRVFHTVAAEGNLADAAAALGRTTSAVSMMLGQFEDEIGAPLFESGRKSRLTPLGRLIAQEAVRGVSAADQAIARIGALAAGQAGRVRLAVVPSVAAGPLPRLVQAFVSQHPDVELELRDMDSRAVIRWLADGRADIGIGSFGDTPGFARKRLMSDRFVLVCGQGHALAQSEGPVSWDDLAGQAFLSHGLCDLIPDPAFAPVLAASRMHVPSTATLLALVDAGAGITVLPERAVPDSYAGLVRRPMPGEGALRHVDLLTEDTPQLPPAVQRFVELVLAEI